MFFVAYTTNPNEFRINFLLQKARVFGYIIVSIIKACVFIFT